MKKIPNRLWDAVSEVCRMRRPSVESLLSRNGYGYEAGKIGELCAAHQQAVEAEEKRHAERNARSARRR
jgi:hypothetical protein